MIAQLIRTIVIAAAVIVGVIAAAVFIVIGRGVP